MKPLLFYHRHNPLAIAKLLLNDLYYWFYASLFRRNISLPRVLNRILLVNPAHLGDIILSTAILRDLKQKFPNCTVDFLAGDWVAPIILGHPGINEVFFLSHWHANRGSETLSEKKEKYQLQVIQVIAKLSNHSYDAVFFLNSYEPSLISLFKKFECPLIGLMNAGGGPLLSYKGDTSLIHEVQIQASLFTPWLGEVKNLRQYQAWLKSPGALGDLKGKFGLTRPYVVIHPGSGNPAKEWLLESWIEVIHSLAQLDLDIVITGDGEREKKQADMLKGNRCINLVGLLNFEQYTAVIANADAVQCVDSVAGHIASAFDKNTVIIGNGLSIIERWYPLGKKSRLFVKKMSCSPCHSHPCEQRTCITSITPQMLINHFPEILEK